MSGLGDFLGRLTGILDSLSLPYMLAGSVASTFHGVPRTTQDVDLVVELNLRSMKALLAAFDPDTYYVSDIAATDALRRGGQFNIIDMETGWKADLIVRKRRPFSLAEFERRISVELLGRRVWIATAEDVVISKLEWGAKGIPDRQIRDVVGVLTTRSESLDVRYIEGWVEELGLNELWRRALDEMASSSDPQ